MLTGTHPFPESSLTALLEHHANDVLPSPLTAPGSAPSTRRSPAAPPRTPATLPNIGGSRPHCERRSQGSRRRRLTCPSARSATRTRASARSSKPTPRTSSGARRSRSGSCGARRGRPGREVPRRRRAVGVGEVLRRSCGARAGAPARGDPGSERWFVVEVVPGLAVPRDRGRALEHRRRPASLMEELERDERGLLRAVDQILPDRDAELLIVLDQFEEGLHARRGRRGAGSIPGGASGGARARQPHPHRRGPPGVLRRTALRRGVRRPARRPDRGDHADVPEELERAIVARPSRPVSSSSPGCSRR